MPNEDRKDQLPILHILPNIFHQRARMLRSGNLQSVGMTGPMEGHMRLRPRSRTPTCYRTVQYTYTNKLMTFCQHSRSQWRSWRIFVENKSRGSSLPLPPPFSQFPSRPFPYTLPSLFPFPFHPFSFPSPFNPIPSLRRRTPKIQLGYRCDCELPQPK